MAAYRQGSKAASGRLTTRVRVLGASAPGRRARRVASVLGVPAVAFLLTPRIIGRRAVCAERR
jgi:hypothetical protein